MLYQNEHIIMNVGGNIGRPRDEFLIGIEISIKIMHLRSYDRILSTIIRFNSFNNTMFNKN